MAADDTGKKRDVAIWYIFFAAIGLLVIQWAWGIYSQVETIPYSQFDQLVAANNVATVAVGSDSIQGTLKTPLPSGKTVFVTARVDADMAAKLAAHGVTCHRCSLRRLDRDPAVVDPARVRLLLGLGVPDPPGS